MEEPATWEKVIVAVLALALIFFMRPGLKAAMERSKAAENKDWAGALLPIGVVVLFVIFLIMMV
ncbi:MAG TPA: hypothetical protein ENJ22_03175 [Gammaproteobacteria bacterium]|nr:hypothetical protein [Gammaproteobacteria bacterium]